MAQAISPAAALALQAGGAIAEGNAKAAEADAQRKQALTNMFIGKTRAVQTDTDARQGLESEMANLRATFAANQQRLNAGTLEIMTAFRQQGERDRRVSVANANQATADLATTAQNADMAAGNARRMGWIRGARSLFSLGDYASKTDFSKKSGT
jgi:hypothetical protein